jgi:hypothetical protein
MSLTPGAVAIKCGPVANEGGAYDELVAYFREHPNE